MRKIIVTEFYTIDNMMSDPKDQMEWVTTTFSKDIGEYEDAIYGNSDILMLGRVTYKIFESYWPTAATNPTAFEGDAEMALKINNIRKIVFSKTLKKVTWNNSEVWANIIPKEIEKLKNQPGKDIIVVGSANIVQQLTNLRLIDEYHILLHPVILGEGKSLFQSITERLNLKLIEAKPFKNGVILLRYQPINDGGK